MQKKRDMQAELKRKAHKKKKKKVAVSPTPLASSSADNSLEGLAWLLQPVSVDRFLSEYFEKQPLHISRNDPAFYASLFTTDDIRALFERKGVLMLKRDLNICRVEDGVRVDFEIQKDEDDDRDNTRDDGI